MRRLGIFLLSAALAAPAWAQMKDHSGHGAQDSAKKQTQSHKGTGVVKSLDAAKGTVMLAHDPIASLRWPSMTMKFIAKDRKMLDKLKPGQKVEFEFIQQDKDYILTRLK
jgi:Cu(I)/Ag(I) efflux system periplasmic protein CusF